MRIASVFEQKSKIAIRSFPRANRSRMLLMESDSLLGIKMGKAVKNWQKHGENNELFRAKRSIFESERAKVRFAPKNKQITHVALFKKAIRFFLSVVKSNDQSDFLTVALF